MPRYEITSPAGEKFEVNAPDGASEADVMAYAEKQWKQQKEAKKAAEPKLIDKVADVIPQVGQADAALAMLSALPAGLIANLAGAYKGITGGKLGTAEGAQEASKFGSDIGQALTYEPKTKAGAENVATISNLLDESKIAGLNPATGLGATPTAPAVAKAAQQAAVKAAEALPSVRAAESAMPGIGAAETAAAAMRRESAASLPVPVKLTEGQATRDFAQQQFERETAKNPTAGQPLRERYAGQNQQILQNFDAWVDQTGAEAPNLRAVGQTVDDALVSKSKEAKTKINRAYDQARKSGELDAPVSTEALANLLNDPLNSAAADTGNAKVLNGVQSALIKLGGATVDDAGKVVPGQLTLNQMEELRQMINRTSDASPNEMRFGKILKDAIDQSTEGAGGDLYKRARSLRASYAQEFEDRAAVNKLVSTKPGTTDRAVAYEDVFKHSVLDGSLDDVRNVRRTLQTAGDDGKQAWKELQGATVKYLKDEATKSVATDINGNPIVSAAGLDKAIKALDKDGKLDFVFGKKGAQQLRDVNDLAKDVLTAPPGSVNTSNTAATIMTAITEAGLTGMVTGLPVPVLTGITQLRKYAKERKLNKRVAEALK